MIYTNPNKANLPNLNETLEILRQAVDSMPKVQVRPFDHPADRRFILTRTNTMFSIKPNIQQSSCLFMGTNCLVDQLRGKWWQFSREEFMLQNVIQEEMRIVMESHPFYRLFSKGFERIQILNPYGIGMAYGQNTAMLPLTSDMNVAAFRASRFSDNDDDGQKISTGVFYLFELRAPMSYIPGLSTVGKQPFERPGRMNLFAYHTNPTVNFNSLPFVKGFEFRHDREISLEWERRFSSPETTLFPNESISRKFDIIRSRKIVSYRAIARNLADNPQDNRENNIRRIRNAGYEIVDSLNLDYTRDELRSEWYDTVFDLWKNFWSDVDLNIINPERQKRILDLPNNPLYSQFFV